jgi:hypothetical protein
MGLLINEAFVLLARKIVAIRKLARAVVREQQKTPPSGVFCQTDRRRQLPLALRRWRSAAASRPTPSRANVLDAGSDTPCGGPPLLLLLLLPLEGGVPAPYSTR